MVSEAVSSGKNVIVFMPDKKTEKHTKYERFLEGLKDKGYVVVVKPEGLAEAIKKAYSGEGKITPPEDDRKIREKLYKLF